MATCFQDGSVLLERDEMARLGRFVEQVEILMEQQKTLKGVLEYSNLCRDSFEEETIRLKREVENLRKQIKADQYAQFHRVMIQDKNLRMGRL